MNSTAVVRSKNQAQWDNLTNRYFHTLDTFPWMLVVACKTTLGTVSSKRNDPETVFLPKRVP